MGGARGLLLSGHLGAAVVVRRVVHRAEYVFSHGAVRRDESFGRNRLAFFPRNPEPANRSFLKGGAEGGGSRRSRTGAGCSDPGARALQALACGAGVCEQTDPKREAEALHGCWPDVLAGDAFVGL